MNTQIRIAVLFHNTFYIHGDRGNILALQKMSKAANIPVTVEYIDDFASSFEPDEYDIIFCGPGEISCFARVRDYLAAKKEELKGFIEKGKVLLVTGTTMCLFGNETLRCDGSKFTGLGIINSNFTEREYPYGNDLYYKAKYNEKEMEIFGSQIQMMDVISEDKPFGKLIYGMGNSKESEFEGVQLNNSVFTNTLGPLLVLNPWLTKEILNVVLTNKATGEIMPDLDMSLELKSLEAKKKFTEKKQVE